MTFIDMRFQTLRGAGRMVSAPSPSGNQTFQLRPVTAPWPRERVSPECSYTLRLSMGFGCCTPLERTGLVAVYFICPLGIGTALHSWSFLDISQQYTTIHSNCIWDLAHVRFQASHGFPVSAFSSAQRRRSAMESHGATVPLRTEEVPRDVSKEPTFATTFSVFKDWIKKDAKYYVDLFVFSGAFYYLDLVSDMNTLYIFYQNGQHRYLSINLAAVLVANLYVMHDMLKAVTCKRDDWPGPGDPGHRILLLGFLVPVFGHVAYLVWISWQLGEKKKHPLLLCSKVAEAGIEAAFSSGIQIYALVYSTWTPEEWWFVAASILVSIGSMSFAFAGIDLQDGLNRIPGLLKHWLSPAFVMVLTFRFAEISSRLSSLALFSVATRKAFQSDDFLDVAGVFEQVLNLILLTGAPLVLLVDLLVLFCLVVHFQRSNKANWNYAIPSVLCFMNPLLERGSPFTIPAWLYFTWRWLQLFGMAGVAFYLVGSERLIAAFADDVRMLQFSAGTTLLWSILLPLLRVRYARHVLSSYSKEVLWTEPFNDGQKMLWEELRRRMFPTEKSLRCLPCRSRDFEPCYESVETQSTSTSKLLFQALSKNWCEQIEEALKDLSDGRQRKSIEKPEAESFKDYEEKSMFPSLYRWKISTLVQHKGAKAETHFLRLLFLSANTLQLPMCAGEGHELETMQRWEELHLKLLKEMQSLLKKHPNKDSMKKLACKNLDTAKCILQLKVETRASKMDDDKMDQERRFNIGKHKARIIEDLAVYAANEASVGVDGYEEMQELLGILYNEKTEGLSLERAKIFGKVWRSCLPEDLSDEKTRGLLRSKTWLEMLDGLRGDILSVLTSVGKRTSRLATHKEVMLEDDSHVPVTSIVDSKMQKAWIKTVRDDIIKACAVLEENAILASENTSEQAAKNEQLLKRFLEVQTDYVDSISEDIRKIEDELQVKERREEHKKNIIGLSRKIDSEVTFASTSAGKGSMADWKKRVKDICGKVKDPKNTDPTGKLGIGVPLPSYWSGGSAFEKWNNLREKCASLQKRLERAKEKLESGVQNEALLQKEEKVDVLSARVDNLLLLSQEHRKVPVLKIGIPLENQLEFWKKIQDSDNFQDKFLADLATHLCINDTHLHLRNLCQATSCKITARCVATEAGFESLRAKYDRETNDYRCDLSGDGDFADLGCALILRRFCREDRSFELVFEGSFECGLTNDQNLLERLEDALNVELPFESLNILEVKSSGEAEANALWCWAYWLSNDDDEDIQEMLVEANCRPDADHETAFNCQIELEADTSDEDTEDGENRRDTDDHRSIGSAPTSSPDRGF
eukprot:s898_g12.t1